MSIKQIVIICVVVAVIVSGVGVGIYKYNEDQQIKHLIDPQVQGSKVAYDIASKGVPVVVEQLGEDSNGYTVQGQTRKWVDSVTGEVVKVVVVLDSDLSPTEYDKVLAHEEFHVITNDDAQDTEANADNYAKERWGYDIQDAYHGIH